MTSALTPELLDLMEHEKVIAEGIATFIDVGWSLVRIRDGKKYRAAGYDNFETYLRERWNMSRRHGYRLIDAAEFAELCPPGHKPKTEGEARQMMRERDHPAPYSDPILTAIGDALPVTGTVVDPFAGTGRIHELATDTRQTIGIEIEPEWADQHDDTICGDALQVMRDMGDGTVDAIATSPTYGNRMADHHEARDDSVRLTYTHTLGRTLAVTNTGAMQWGNEYRDFHRDAWAEAVRISKPGGRFVLNVKNHVRDDRVERVAEWHMRTLIDLGLRLEADDIIVTRGVMAGANATVRVDHEKIVTFRKGAANE